MHTKSDFRHSLYSQRSVFSQCQNQNDQLFKQLIVQISVVRVFFLFDLKLVQSRPFYIKGVINLFYIKWSRLAKTSEKPNVRTADRSDFRHKFVSEIQTKRSVFGHLSVRSNLVPNDDPLSEIRTCSDFRRLLYQNCKTK